MLRWALTLGVAGTVMASTATPQVPPGLPPTHADLEYAPPLPTTSKGHKLDLYLPAGAKPWPVVIWTGGSAWMADTGKRHAGALALRLNPAGYAVAGVSIRSSSQVKFPGQLHDIKAAVRWLRANAATYNLDLAHQSRGTLRRLDGRDGGGDRRCAGDGGLGRDGRRLESSAGGGRLLSADQLLDDGRLGGPEV
jgi:hypothetical protein